MSNFTTLPVPPITYWQRFLYRYLQVLPTGYHEIDAGYRYPVLVHSSQLVEHEMPMYLVYVGTWRLYMYDGHSQWLSREATTMSKQAIQKGLKALSQRLQRIRKANQLWSGQ